MMEGQDDAGWMAGGAETLGHGNKIAKVKVYLVQGV
jgi:hypothetical protein